MKKIASLIAAVGLVGLGAVTGSAGQARAADEVNTCPTADASSFLDPWLLVRAGDGSVRLADRDGDGSVCLARIVVRGRVLLTLATDNAVGNPGIIPPGPCIDPFVPLAVGNPNIRKIDANADGVLCGAASLEARALIIVLVDNPSALPR